MLVDRSTRYVSLIADETSPRRPGDVWVGLVSAHVEKCANGIASQELPAHCPTIPSWFCRSGRTDSDVLPSEARLRRCSRMFG